jgi:uncharacterized membrane protein
MRLDPNPLFRRIIIPWYDSPLLCWILLLSMLVLLFFSVSGILVAENDPAYRRFIWVPVVLLVLSLLMIWSVSNRLIRRSNHQKED